jgi:hypothetical protein
MKPAYWAPSGAGAEWSTEQARTPAWSLKLAGAGESNWTMDQGVRNWNSSVPGNVEIVVGGFFRAEGVNTTPTTDAEKYQLVFEFFGAGVDLLGAPLVLDLPQDQATSTDWIEVDNTQIAPLTLPSDADSVAITFRKGASATGAMYFDDMFIRGGGGFFNPNMDAGDTWYYWWRGFESGGDWPATQKHFQYVTDGDANTGTYSLLIEENPAASDPSSETVGISDRVPVTPGEPVLVSYWLRYDGMNDPDSIGTGDYNVGMTVLWYDNLEGGPAGWGEIGGADVRLNGEYNDQVIPLATREATTGWKQYAHVVYPRDGAVGMELRVRYWHKFTGTTYWDDVAIVNIGGSTLATATGVEDETGKEVPSTVLLLQNYPNPFTSSTTVAFNLPQSGAVTLSIYNVLGQRIATMVNDKILPAGPQRVEFDAAGLPSGVYIYVLEANKRTEARTMVLLK